MADDLLFTLGIQDKGAGRAIKELNKELKYLDKEYKATSKGSKEFEKTQEGLKTKLKYLEKSYDANKAKLQVYKKQMEETKKNISDKEKELQKLTSAENVNEKAVAKATQQLDNMKSSLKQTERNINLTEIELENLNEEIESTRQSVNKSDLDKYKEQMEQLGEQLEKTGEKFTKIGQGMSTVGGSLMKISAPLVAFSAYAVKVTADFEAGMAKVQAISGATGKELEMLKDKAKEMGAITKFSATESAEALSYMAMAGWKAQDMVDGLEGIMNLAAASGESLALVSDIVTDALTAFGMSAKESGRFADILAAASSNANTNVAMMGETFKYVAPVAGAMKYSAEDTAVAIGLMANSGIKASQAGTSLRQILLGLQGGVEVTTKGAKKFRIEVENADGTMRAFDDVLSDLRQSFSLMTDAQKAQNAELIAGKVGMSGLLAIVNAAESDFVKLTKAVENCDGTAKKMADTMNNTAQGQLTLLKSQLEALGIQIGEKLLPFVNKFIEKLSKLIDWFANLSEGTQQMIVQTGLLTFALGGALKAVGSMSMGIGSLISVAGKFATHLGTTATATTAVGTASTAAATGGIATLLKSFMKFSPIAVGVGVAIGAVNLGMKASTAQNKLLGKTILDTTDDMSSMEKAVSKLNNMHFKSREELIKLGLVYDDLSDSISEDFAGAVKNTQLELNKFNMFLRDISIDKIIDENEEEVFLNTVGDMTAQAIKLVKEGTKEGKESLNNMFKLDDNKIDENEKIILKMLESQSKIQIDELNKLEKEIFAIKDKAIKEKRGLNEQEIKDVEEKTQRIKQIELEALGSTQEEILYAKNEFAARMATIDLEGASTLIQEKAKQREDEIVKIQASYDTQLMMLDNLLQQEQAKGAEADQKKVAALQAEIEQNEQAKQQKIQQQDELYNEYLRILGEKNPEILGEINKFNGEILTAEDKKSKQQLDLYKLSFDELNSVTKSGTYSMYNKHNQMWDNVTVKVDESTGELLGVYSEWRNRSGGYTAKMGEDVAKLGKEYNDSKKKIEKALKDSEKITVDSSGNIVTANGKTSISLKDITTDADGTRKGILDLNGTPVEVKVNKDGAVGNLNAIRDAILNIPTKRSVTITTNNVSTGGGSTNNGKRIIEASQTVDTTYKAITPNTDSLITEGGFYNSKTPESRNLINSYNIIQSGSYLNSNKSDNTKFDYNKLANIIATTMVQAVKNLEINPNIEVKVDGTPLNSKFSNNLAMGIRRNR